MRNARLNYVIVGTFVLTCLAGMIVSIALLTGRTGSVDTYFTVYDEVTGLKYGTQVLYEGYPIGQLEEIEPIREGGRMRFKVRLSVIEDWAIPTDSIAQIASPGLLSALAINIQAGFSAVPLEPGASIKGQAASNMFAAVSSVAGQVDQLLNNDVRPLINQVNLAVSSLTSLMEGDGAVLLQELQTAASSVGEFAPQIGENLAAFSEDLRASGNQISDIMTPDNSQRITNIVTDLETLAASMGETRRTFDRVMVNLDNMIADNKTDVDQTVVDMRYTMESVARRIDSINHNLEGASRNMFEFSRHIRQNPGLLLGGTPPQDEAN